MAAVGYLLAAGSRHQSARHLAPRGISLLSCEDALLQDCLPVPAWACALVSKWRGPLLAGLP